MRVWNMHTREATQSFLKKDRLSTFRPDGKLLASGDLHGITIWDIATRTKIRQFPVHTGRFARLTFSPSGRMLISMGDRKRTVRWWNVEKGQEIYRLSSLCG
ncbi:WD40 repeat domain-containing protein [Ktedonobacter sp. SOSP1-52]|uniref:WD40 repeat domain-containing protein n=1 Tax=Ktedonobacter sp. SOSP1-52 TaxID=2778366 RepID=UPI0035B36994